jgi:hypothetical protein
MATKNLARTAIEGGRTGRNTWERRYSHNTERTSEREYCNQAKLDPESAIDYDIKDKDVVYKNFDDKLGPMYRWLRSQVGRPWDEVRSEVAKTFDTRTTAGRHITYDHLLASVEVTPDLRYRKYSYGPVDQTTSYYKNDFFVNEEGILCSKTYIPRNQRGHKKIPAWNTNQMSNWLGGRIVGKVGNKYFWFIPSTTTKKYGGTDYQWMVKWGNYGKYYFSSNSLTFLYLATKPIYKVDSNFKVVTVDNAPVIIRYEQQWTPGSPTSLRQGRKLDTKEMEYWNSIPEYYKEKILELSPTHPGPPKDTYRYYY